MRGYLRLLEYTDISPKQRQYLQAIERVILQTYELIENVRTLRQLSQESKTTLSLDSIIRKAIELVHEQAKHQEFQIRYQGK